MKRTYRKIALAILVSIFLCFAVILSGLLIFQKESGIDDSTADAAAATTTLTLAADKTEIAPGDTITLTATFSSTRSAATLWDSISVYVGPLAGDNTTMNANVCKYLKVTSKKMSFSAANYFHSTTDKFASGLGLLLSISNNIEEEESASTNCVFTIKILVAADAPLLGDFTFGMNPISTNAVRYNTGSIYDRANTGALACNTLTFSMGAPSDDAKLSSVNVGHGSATVPITLADNMSYVSTNATQSNFKVRPVASDSGATITIGKDTEDPTTAVLSGAEATVPLAGGVTNITIKVTAADKTTVKRYYLTVTCGYVQFSGLTATTNSPTTTATKNGLDGSHSTSKTSYKVYVPSDATTVNITSTVAANYGISTSIALTKTGSLTIPSTNTATSGTAFAVQNVATGDTLTLTARAADNTTTVTYTITFEKVSVNTNIKTFTMTGKGQSVKYYNDTAQTTGNIDYCFVLPYSCDYSGTFDIELDDTTSTVKVGTAAYNPATNYVGGSTYNVVVTAQAGNSRTYRVNVVKNIVPAEFTSLKFSQNGTNFTDVFTASEYNSTTRTFTKKINVTEFGGSTPQIYIGGTTTPDATVSVTGGLKTNSSTASGEAKNYYATLAIGTNTFTMQASSSAGNMVYTFVINYVEELNTITAMTIKNAANSVDVSGFTFATATTSYSVSVPYKTTSVNIAAVTDGQYAAVYTESGSKITRNNSTKTHTVTRALNVGANTIKLHAVADEGKGAAGTEYTLTITRQPAENDSKLSGLVVREGGASGTPLPFTDSNGDPVSFDPNVLNYNIVLPEDHSGVLNVFIDAPTSGSEATVSGAGAVNLGTIVAGVDNAKVISVTVTAEDGSKTTYRVIISQKAIVLDDSIELSELTILGSDGNTYFTSAVSGLTYGNYPAITVPYLVERVNVSATAVSSKATLHGTGNHELTVIGGSGNLIEVYVSAEDGTNGNGAQKYVFTIIREKAAEHAWLTDLQVNGTTLSGFDSEKFTYSLREPSSSDRVSLNAVAEEERAKITVSVGGTVICSDFGTAYASAVQLGGKGQIIVITINVTLDDVTTPYTLNIARASDKPYLTSLNVGGLDIRDVNGNIIDGYDESVVSVMEDFYVEIVYSTVGSIIIQATANDASAELRLPGDNGELTFSSLFEEDGATASVQIAVIPIVGEVAVYYVHFTSLTSSTLADINIREITQFNEAYTDDRTVYGIYTVDYRLGELFTEVNFPSQAGYGVGTYQIFYNDVLKNDNGKDVAGVSLKYGFNYVCINLTSSDKRAKKTVVVLVERELPYFESISIEEIGGFASDYQKDRTDYFYQVSADVSSLHFTIDLAEKYRYEIENASELKAGLNQVRVYIYERSSANSNTGVADAQNSAVRVISVAVFREQAGTSLLWTIVFYGLIALCVLLLLLLIIVAMRKKTVVQQPAPYAPAAPIIVTTPAPYIMPQQHDGVTPIIVTPAQYVQQPVAGQPTVQQPIVQPIVQPVIQQPVQPVVQQPVVQQPVVQQVVQQPTAQPAAGQPAAPAQQVAQQAAPVQPVVQPAAGAPVQQAAQPTEQPFVMPPHLDKSQFVEPQFMQTSPLPQFIETETPVQSDEDKPKKK